MGPTSINMECWLYPLRVRRSITGGMEDRVPKKMFKSFKKKVNSKPEKSEGIREWFDTFLFFLK